MDINKLVDSYGQAVERLYSYAHTMTIKERKQFYSMVGEHVENLIKQKAK